jgi:AcrR family transcriptional regulator
VPRQSERTTRQRLIEAAAQLIAEEGYERVSVQAVARRAGLTNGAIYGNFRDKAHLLAAAVELRLHRLADAVEEGRKARTAPIDLIGHMARSLALVTPDPDRRLLVEAYAAAWRDPVVGALVRERLHGLESAIIRLAEQARDDGDLADEVDPATLARFGMAAVLGFHMIHTAGVPDPDQESWLRLWDRALASIRKAPPAPR